MLSLWQKSGTNFMVQDKLKNPLNLTDNLTDNLSQISSALFLFVSDNLKGFLICLGP